MLFACGLSGYSFAIFHLFNHAFFKALLFLSAGSIIHSLLIEQDLRKMGGLNQLLPLAFISIFFSSLSLMGFPFLSGFYSKDAILELAFAGSSIGFFAFLLGSISAFLTSLYSIRLLILTFLIKPNTFRSYILITHDAPLFMAIPLIILFTPSILSGYLTYDIFLFSNYWKQSLFILPQHYLIDLEFIAPNLPTILSICGTLFGIFIFFYYPFWTTYKLLYHFLYFKWYFDVLYNKYIIIPSLYIGRYITFEILDRGFFNIEYLAIIVNKYVFLYRFFQNGLLYDYFLFFFFGIFFIS